MKGTFIVIDGPDRCGKDTVVEFLKEQFPDAVYPREPGGTREAELTRDMLLDENNGFSPFTQMCFFFAARRDLLDKVTRTALDEGELVILPRSAASTLAYQVDGEQAENLRYLFWHMYEECFENYKPHLHILLDVPASVSRARPSSEGDNKNYFELKDEEYHERVRLGFLKFHHVQHTPTVVVDATQPLEKVQQKVHKIIREEIAYKKRREAIEAGCV